MRHLPSVEGCDVPGDHLRQNLPDLPPIDFRQVTPEFLQRNLVIAPFLTDLP
jgi:hypothetical protein